MPVAQTYPPDPLTVTLTAPVSPIWVNWTHPSDPTSWDWELWQDDFLGVRVANGNTAGVNRSVNSAYVPGAGTYFRGRVRSIRAGVTGPWTNSVRTFLGP